MNIQDKPPAVVLGLSPTGLAVARSLGRKNVPVIGFSRNGSAIGSRSRYVQETLVAEGADWEESLIEQLFELGSRLDEKPVLFCAEDIYLAALANHAEDLRRAYRMPASLNREMIELFLDKERFYKMCTEESVTIPQTYFPDTLGDVVEASKVLSYPCIVKPSFSHLWRQKLKGRKMIEAHSSNELIQTYKQFSSWGARVMVQEIVPGGDDHIYLGGVCIGNDDLPLALFTGRKLRQFPPMFGSASLAESVDVPEIARMSADLLQKLKFRGICGTEYKLDPRDGQFKMMEINLRPVLWFSLVEACGVDVIYATYADLAGLPVPKFSQQDGVRWIYSARDLITAGHYLLHGGLTLSSYLSTLRSIKACAVYAPDDSKIMLSAPKHLLKELKEYYLGGRE